MPFNTYIVGYQNYTLEFFYNTKDFAIHLTRRKPDNNSRCCHTTIPAQIIAGYADQQHVTDFLFAWPELLAWCEKTEKIFTEIPD